MAQQPIVRIKEQSALRKEEQSIQYDSNMHRVGIPWQSNEPELPNNYKMALRRLENTEKKLSRSPQIATAYCDIINQYEENGYIRKVGDEERNKTKWLLPHFQL